MAIDNNARTNGSPAEEHIVFFVAGNPEVHRILRLAGRSDEQIYESVSSAFRVACILGDLVLHSSSTHYESTITRRLRDEYHLLFRAGVSRFVVREDLRDFATDLDSARDTYPQTPDYSGYFGKKGDRSLQDLRRLGFIYYRSGQMGETIDTAWRAGLDEGVTNDVIVQRIQNNPLISVPERDRFLQTLRVLPSQRGRGPFVWDVIEDAARQSGISIPAGLQNELRMYLLRTYLRSAAKLYHPARVLTTPKSCLGDILGENGVDRYNPELFRSFCETLNIRWIVERLKPEDILSVRELLEFVPFRVAYFGIIDTAKNIQDAKIGLLKQVLAEASDVALFHLQAYSELNQVAIDLAKSPKLLRQYSMSPDKLHRRIVDPESIAFRLMREAILEKYSYRMEKVADQFIRKKEQREFPQIALNIGKAEIVMGDKNTGDQYMINQAAVVGPHGHAHDISLQQVLPAPERGEDLKALALELSQLRISLHQSASSPQEMIAVAAVAEAQNEAEAGNSDKTMNALQRAGKWGLDVAEKIGTELVVAYMKSHCGM